MLVAWLEPARLLLVAAVADEHLRVARVVSAAVEDLRREEAPAHDLGERGVVPIVEPGAVLAVGQKQVPQTGGLRLGLELLHDGRMRHRRQSSVRTSWARYVGSFGTTRSRTKRSTWSV
jgi:hypothetical protein